LRYKASFFSGAISPLFICVYTVVPAGEGLRGEGFRNFHVTQEKSGRIGSLASSERGGKASQADLAAYSLFLI